MKLTKSQLKKLIKEAFAEKSALRQEIVDKLAEYLGILPHEANMRFHEAFEEYAQRDSTGPPRRQWEKHLSLGENK